MHRHGGTELAAVETAPGRRTFSESEALALPRWLFGLLLFAATLALGLWRIGTPSLWRDEAATVAAARSGFGGIIRTSGDVDAVHAPYYILMWAWTSVAGDSEVALRVPSAVAIAATAVCLYVLATRYVSAPLALTAGLLFVVMPVASRYAQEAREGAFVMLLATAATLALHRALHRDGRSSWAVFVVLSALPPLLNLLSAYIVLAWVVLALTVARRATVLVATVAPALVVAAVMAAFSAGQRETMLNVFLAKPAPKALIAYADQVFGNRALAAVFILAAVAFVVRAAVTRRWDLAWLIVILVFPAPLWIVSQLEPVFLFRYGLFAAPFFALATVLALSRLVLAVPVLVVVLALGAPLQLDYRQADGHSDNFRGVLAEVGAAGRPDDAMITDSWLTRAATNYYLPDRLADPLDPGSRTSPQIRSSGGLPCRADLFAQYDRVWFIQSERTNDQITDSRPEVCLPGFTTTQERTDRGVRAELWERTRP